MVMSASGWRARSWFRRLRVRRSVSALRWCQPGPRSAYLASGLARRCQTMTRMERATAHLALFPSRRLDRRRSLSPRKVLVPAAPLAAWVQ